MPVIFVFSWLNKRSKPRPPVIVKQRISLANPHGFVAHVLLHGDGVLLKNKQPDPDFPPAGKHEHLAPGGPHIMLMGLTRELPAGSEELACTLTFDDGQTIDILAPVKEFTEEQDTYHTHE